MNKIFSTLSLLGFSSCVATSFPKTKLYVADITNQVCVEYEIVDLEQITIRPLAELPLKAKGPCDRMAGFSRHQFKAVQNWIRDQIRENK